MKITHVSRQTTRAVGTSLLHLIEHFMKVYRHEAYGEPLQVAAQDTMLCVMLQEQMRAYDMVSRVSLQQERAARRGQDAPKSFKKAFQTVIRDHIPASDLPLVFSLTPTVFDLALHDQRFMKSSWHVEPLNALIRGKHHGQYGMYNLSSASYLMYLMMDDATRARIAAEFNHCIDTMTNVVQQQHLSTRDMDYTELVLLYVVETMRDYFTAHVMAAYVDTFRHFSYTSEYPIAWQLPILHQQFMDRYTARRPELYQLLYSVMQKTSMNTLGLVLRIPAIRATIRTVLTDMLDYTPARHSITTA